MATGRSELFKTPVCRVSYARDLFKARSQEEGKPPKYGATLIFPVSADKSVFEGAAAKAMEETWPGKWKEWLAAGIIKSPFKAGDGKEARNKQSGELHPGMGKDVWFVRVQSGENSPPVIRWKDANIPATTADVYSGCYGFAMLNAFTYDHPTGGKGVSFGIAYFQKTGEGESLGGEGGGPIDPTKYFEKVADEGVAPETKGGAGAGGLFG